MFFKDALNVWHEYAHGVYGCLASLSRLGSHRAVRGGTYYSKLVGEWSFSFWGRYHVYLTAARSRNNMALLMTDAVVCLDNRSGHEVSIML
jgi:hypothetical protein